MHTNYYNPNIPRALKSGWHFSGSSQFCKYMYMYIYMPRSMIQYTCIYVAVNCDILCTGHISNFSKYIL